MTGKKELINEISRQANLMDIDPKLFPRPKGWSNPKLKKWLLKNRICAGEETWMMEKIYT